MEIALKSVGILATVFALYKITVDVFLAKSTKRRDEYSFTKEFLHDLNLEEIHPLVVEKGFLALSGMVLKEPEIRFILNQDSPSTLIDLRRDVSGFLTFNPQGLRYEWKAKYRSDMRQKIGKFMYLLGYFILATFGLVLLMMKGSYENLTNLSFLIFCVSMLITAIACLAKHENIKQAYLLMSEQQNLGP